MANILFLLESNFKFNSLLQQTFGLPPLRSPLIPLSYDGNNSFKLNYFSYKVIIYSPKLRSKCFFMSPKPIGDNGIGVNGYGLDNDLKAVASTGINEVHALHFPVITGVLLALLMYDHHHGSVALAASGARMGGSSFSSSSSSRNSKPSLSSSSSTRSNPSFSSSSSSTSSKPSVSSSSSTRSNTSFSSSSSSSSSTSSKPSVSSSSTRSKPSFSSSSSSPKSPRTSSSSSWSPSSSSIRKSSSSSTRPKSSLSSRSSPSSSSSSPLKGDGSGPAIKVDRAVEVGPAVAVEPTVEVGSAVGVGPAVVVKPAVGVTSFIGCTMFVLALGFVAKTLSHKLAERTSVLKLQVGLSGEAGISLRKELNWIAKAPMGYNHILYVTTGALLRRHEYWISGYSSADIKWSIVEVERLFSQLSIEERGKFDKQNLVNVNNIRWETQRSRDFHNEYIVITIIVSAKGVHSLPDIYSRSTLKEALQSLRTITSKKVMAVEVLWTPQKEDDILTVHEYHKDYSLLRSLRYW